MMGIIEESGRGERDKKDDKVELLNWNPDERDFPTEL